MSSGADRYARDAGMAAAARLLPFGVQLAATPFVVGSLGAGGYALWALLATTINLLLTADLGVVGVMQRYTSIHRGSGDAAAAARVTTTVLAVLLALLALALVLAPWLGGLGVAVVEVPDGLRPQARFLFSCAGVIAVLHLLSLALSGHLAGVERFGAVLAVSAAARTVLVVGTAAALLGGWGLRGLVLAAGADALVAVCVAAVLTRRHLATAFRGVLGRAELADVWAFAWRNQLSGLGFMAQRELDVLIAGVLLPAASIGAVAAAAQSSAAAALFPLVFLTPLFSRLSTVVGQRDAGALTGAARGAQESWLGVVVPYAAVVVAVVPFAVPAWAGEDLPGAAGLAALLLLGLVATLSVAVLATLVRACGHPGAEAGAYAGYAVSKVALGIPMALAWGTWGLAASTLVASAVFVAVLLATSRPVLRAALTGPLPLVPPTGLVVRALAAAALSALLAWGASSAIGSRVGLLAALALVGALGLVVGGVAGRLRSSEPAVR